MDSLAAEKLVHILTSGGWVMIPLVILACLIYTNAFDLVFYLLKLNLGKQRAYEWEEWVDEPEKAKNKRVKAIVEYTKDGNLTAKQIRNRFEEVRQTMLSTLDRRITYLSTLVAVAPLMGLLGTVIGMSATFTGIAAGAGAETGAMVAGGISEALITTQTGLTIALPGIFMLMLIKRQKHTLEAKIAQLESIILANLKLEF